MDLQRENDRKGLVGTVFIHIILFLLLLIWTVGQANEMLEEQGAVEVSFGDPISGGEDATSEVAETSPTEPSESNPSPSQNTPQTNDPVVTNDQEDAPEVNTSSNPKTTTETEKKEEQAKVDPRIQKMLDKIKAEKEKKNSDQNSNAGEGKDDKPGGQETATQPGPGGANQGDNGSGMSWSLKGFAVADWPDIKNNSQDVGKVVVDICLDASGSINRISIGPGTTTSSKYLRDLSIQSVKQFKFKAKGGQTANNCGTITIIYKTN